MIKGKSFMQMALAPNVKIFENNETLLQMHAIYDIYRFHKTYVFVRLFSKTEYGLLC